jgi:hypothetical protein
MDGDLNTYILKHFPGDVTAALVESLCFTGVLYGKGVILSVAHKK